MKKIITILLFIIISSIYGMSSDELLELIKQMKPEDQAIMAQKIIQSLPSNKNLNINAKPADGHIPYHQLFFDGAGSTGGGNSKNGILLDLQNTPITFKSGADFAKNSNFSSIIEFIKQVNWRFGNELVETLNKTTIGLSPRPLARLPKEKRIIIPSQVENSSFQSGHRYHLNNGQLEIYYYTEEIKKMNHNQLGIFILHELMHSFIPKIPVGTYDDRLRSFINRFSKAFNNTENIQILIDEFNIKIDFNRDYTYDLFMDGYIRQLHPHKLSDVKQFLSQSRQYTIIQEFYSLLNYIRLFTLTKKDLTTIMPKHQVKDYFARQPEFLKRCKILLKLFISNIDDDNIIQNSLLKIDYSGIKENWPPERLDLLQILIDNGADVNARDDNEDQESVFNRISLKQTFLLEFFLKRGMDINMRGDDDQLPIAYPNYSNISTVELFIKYSANIHLEPLGRYKDGSALTTLVEEGYYNKNNKFEVLQVFMTAQNLDYHKLIDAYKIVLNKKISPREGSTLSYRKPLFPWESYTTNYSLTDEKERKMFLEVLGNKILELMEKSQDCSDEEYEEAKDLIKKGKKSKGNLGYS